MNCLATLKTASPPPPGNASRENTRAMGQQWERYYRKVALEFSKVDLDFRISWNLIERNSAVTNFKSTFQLQSPMERFRIIHWLLRE